MQELDFDITTNNDLVWYDAEDGTYCSILEDSMHEISYEEIFMNIPDYNHNDYIQMLEDLELDSIPF